MAGNDGDFARLSAARAAFLDDILGDLASDPLPIRPDEGGRRLVRLKVYLKHLDALGFGLLDLTGQQLNGRIVHDEHIRLLADGLGEQLRHRPGVERRVANIDGVAVDRRVLASCRAPKPRSE